MKIKIDKKDETAVIGDISWSSDDETNGEEMDFSSLKLYKIGSHVKVTDGGKVRYLGLIVSVDENTRPPHSYKALDFSYNLKGQDIIQFKNMSAADAIKKLMGRQGITCKIDCKLPTKITKIYKDTVVNILKNILKKCANDQGKKYFFEVNGTDVCIREKNKMKISPTFMMADDGAISRSIEELKNEVMVVKDNKILATATGKDTKQLGVVRYIDEDNDISKAKAQGEAKTQLKQMDRVKSSKSVTLLVTKGYWDIRKGRLIKLNGGGLKGWYNIRSVSHSIEGTTHKVNIEVSWSGKL